MNEQNFLKASPKPTEKPRSILDEAKEDFGFDPDVIQKETGIDFSNLSYKDSENHGRAKICFLLLWKECSAEKQKELLDFIKKFGEDGVNSLSAITLNNSNSEKILAIGKNIEEEKAKEIFAKISEISVYIETSFPMELASETIKIQKLASDSFNSKEMDKVLMLRESAYALHASLLEKTQQLLDETQEYTLSDKNENDWTKFRKKLTTGNKEIFLLSNFLKILKEDGIVLSPEYINNLEFETKEIGEDLSEEDKNKILEISRKNYFNIVFPNEPEKARVVVEGLEKELFPEKFPNDKIENVKNQKTYTLKYKGSIIAFCKFKLIPGKPDELEFTSVNVSSDLQGLNIGEYFISKVLEIEAKKYIINGDTFVKNTGANKLYFEKVGFENLGEYESEKYLGEKLYKMRMDKRETSR